MLSCKTGFVFRFEVRDGVETHYQKRRGGKTILGKAADKVGAHGPGAGRELGVRGELAGAVLLARGVRSEGKRTKMGDWRKCRCVAAKGWEREIGEIEIASNNLAWVWVGTSGVVVRQRED